MPRDSSETSQHCLAPGEVSPEAVRSHLEKVLESPIFSRAPRMARFLAFVVEQTAEGKGAELREQAIAAEVFDKPGDFDPRLDPIVRVEARRLRSRLNDYYQKEFTSLSQAAKVLGVNKKCITDILSGRTKTTKARDGTRYTFHRA